MLSFFSGRRSSVPTASPAAGAPTTPRPAARSTRQLRAAADEPISLASDRIADPSPGPDAAPTRAANRSNDWGVGAADAPLPERLCPPTARETDYPTPAPYRLAEPGPGELAPALGPVGGGPTGELTRPEHRAAFAAGPLPDFSGVRYEELRDGFPSPPGAPGRTAGTPAGSRHRKVDERHTVLPSAVAGAVLDQLALAQPAIAADLMSEPIEVLLPTRAGPGHYRIQELDDRFYARAKNGARHLRTLAHALPGPGLDERQPDELDRLELVRLVATTVAILHARELISGGLDLDTFAFSLSPRPEVAVIHPDRLRPIGGEFLLSAPSRDDWDSLDRDRFDFGVLAYRLLVGLRGTADIDLGHRPYVLGLDDSQSNELWRLWRRLSGAAGTRPQMSEWTRGLKP